ncbi:hypothetical protein E8D34_10705 [Nocardioides sp. GY 10113]|uniref:hypothetical protein n=1 Tax=Nocardioides sp. GY 10113 TaxID=2569761 RepID=UPI0010A935A9|nr:hypothetical protein [Nocardioides sp. GY 10113]TIC86711.1 hypothetical protein E8D34_10705 [Nocardioides sp. GY 10113]
MAIEFTAPVADAPTDAQHHARAAAQNVVASAEAAAALMATLNGMAEYEKVLLRAAAGAGKSVALVSMVGEALANPNCLRIAVTAFANKQVIPLAQRLGAAYGPDKVCLFVSKAWEPKLPEDLADMATVVTKSKEIPESARIVLGVSHKFKVIGEYSRMHARLGPGANGERIFDVLFVDEAWQMPLHLFTGVEGYAPVAVGVGDVGQLPPIDPSENPWRGDPGYNPYRAWPTAYEGLATTFARDLPAVWRPTAEQLPLWRAFYGDWDRLDCVAAPGDRHIDLPVFDGDAGAVWSAVATGHPVLLEVDGLPEAEAPDIDPPLLAYLEDLLRPLLEGGFSTVEARYDDVGDPFEEHRVTSDQPTGDPLVVVLATRNQAVDDATAMVERLTKELDLPEGVLVASTVDSWQGQTNRITVALHPLSGADQLDEFNSAFGRLAVTCTRATHGLLLLARAGLDDLLDGAAARPGTPLGEPGTRALPRQTHQRILAAFTRGTCTTDVT